MTIHRALYQPYRGQVSPAHQRFWVITRRELHLAWSHRWVRRLVILSFLPLVVCLIVLYVELVIQKTLNMDLWGGEVFESLYKAQTVFVVLLMAVAGADLISKDVAANAHSLYFARPLGVLQYILGKVLAVSLLVGLITIVPGILLDVGQLVLAWDADITAFFAKLVQVVGYSVILSIVAGCFIACLSSFGIRARYVGLLWIALYFISNAVSAALREALSGGDRIDALSLISLQTLFVESGRFFYAAQRPPVWPLLVLLGLFALAAGFLYWRVVALERREA